MEFKLKSIYKPSGDQPQAIEKLVAGLARDNKYQTLLGVTGSGKTATMAWTIEQTQRPTLVIAHNKTLAAQLCNEFREFFPDNAVEYFVSYYDYYQPEAYMPKTDTYIEKDAQINEEIDRLRHAATQALLTRRDVIIVASVSCIYGLGSPETYAGESIHFSRGEELDRATFMRKLVALQFVRTTADLKRGQFRVHGAVMEVNPVNEEVVYRIEMNENRIAHILAIDPVTRKVRGDKEEAWIFPAKHFVTLEPARQAAEKAIMRELEEQLAHFRSKDLLLEAERLERRTKYDLEMIRHIGYCSGIENYSRHLDARGVGEPPSTLLSYFPKDFLMFIDESHVTVPQLGAMYNGDRARKTTLIDNGFRLPSAYDNRPLKFPEFLERVSQCVFVSATPGPWELEHSAQVVEQIVRPTGLVDPEIMVRPVTASSPPLKGGARGGSGSKSQVEDVIFEVKLRAEKNERILITTLTKKMAEDLTDYLAEKRVKAKYLHSEIQTLDRIRILTQFRQGKFDCLVGVNLLREGLDLPEVTLVAIMDADKEGFLRSDTSLIQTIGRAARNVLGQVILYADVMTGSMKRAISETNRRRVKQLVYNKEHGITPQTIKKEVKDITKILGIHEKDVKEILELEMKYAPSDVSRMIKEKETQMRAAAKNLEFELAALLRDEIKLLEKKLKTPKKEEWETVVDFRDKKKWKDGAPIDEVIKRLK